MKENIEESKISTKVPTDISKNAAFVVDTTILRNEEYAKCDDMGAWECTGSKKIYYRMSETGIVSRTKTTKESQKHDELKRELFANASDTFVRKNVVTVRNMITDTPKELRFIQYVFEEGNPKIVVKPHGNPKGKDVDNGSYKRTTKSTKELILKKLKSVPPRMATDKIIEERGDIMNICQAGDFPRNRNQVHNINRKLKKRKGSPLQPNTSNDRPVATNNNKGERRTERKNRKPSHQRNSFVSRTYRFSGI